MRSTTCLPLFVAAVLSAGCLPAFAQANVIENQTTFVYVNAAGGSDANPGTQASPLQTISAAVSKANYYANRNIGVKIEVGPGTYHEFVQVGWAKYYPTLTIEATQIGTAIVDGADLVTGWAQASGNAAVYTHAFASLGANPVPTNWPTTLAPVVYRREMIFVNGQRFEQVMAQSDMIPGTFYVDDMNQVLDLVPLPGTDMQSATIEVAARPYTFQSHSRPNLVLRGLVFEHAATVMNQESAMINGGSNILIDQIEAHDNNWGGFGLHRVNYATLQNSFSHANGALGFMTAFAKNVLSQNDEADYNNWRGEQAGFYDFGMGGYKFFATHGATVDGLNAYNNGAEGLWFDTDNRQITVTNSTLEGNYDTNLQVELNVGPITVQNTSLCFGTIGANLVNAKNVTFANDTFLGNTDPTQTNPKAQFFLAGAPGGRHFTDWETGVYENVISQNVTFTGNHFMNNGAQQILFFTSLRNSDLATFSGSFQGSGNTWYDGVQLASFEIDGSHLTLAQWESTTGDQAQWAPSAHPRSCSVSTYASPDFQVFIPSIHEWVTIKAKNGTATIPISVKNFATGSPVTLSVLSSSGVNALLSANAVAASAPGKYAGGITNLVVSSSQPGTQFVTVQATSGGHVHTLTIPVIF